MDGWMGRGTSRGGVKHSEGKKEVVEQITGDCQILYLLQQNRLSF
jgi:hypothetical protein